MQHSIDAYYAYIQLYSYMGTPMCDYNAKAQKEYNNKSNSRKQKKQECRKGRGRDKIASTNSKHIKPTYTTKR